MFGKKKEKKPVSKVRKIISWVTTGIFLVFCAFVITAQVVANVSKGNNYGVPNFNGFQFSIVLTDSMETRYPKGTMVFVQKQEINDEKIKPGDSLMFYYEPWSSMLTIQPIVTHEVVSIEPNTNPSKFGEGEYAITLHGINKNSENCQATSPTGEKDCTNQYQYITEKSVLGKVVGHSTFLGSLYSFVTSIWGLIVLLGIPVLYLIISSIIDLCKAIKNPEPEIEVKENNVASNGALDELSEEDKKRLKQEMLDEIMGKGKDDDK